jgi:hypothetical protein
MVEAKTMKKEKRLKLALFSVSSLNSARRSRNQRESTALERSLEARQLSHARDGGGPK